MRHVRFSNFDFFSITLFFLVSFLLGLYWQVWRQWKFAQFWQNPVVCIWVWCLCCNQGEQVLACGWSLLWSNGLASLIEHVLIFGIELKLAGIEANVGNLFNANDIYLLFQMIFSHISLHCKLVPVQSWEYEYGLLTYTQSCNSQSFSCRCAPLTRALRYQVLSVTHIFLFPSSAVTSRLLDDLSLGKQRMVWHNGHHVGLFLLKTEGFIAAFSGAICVVFFSLTNTIDWQCTFLQPAFGFEEAAKCLLTTCNDLVLHEEKQYFCTQSTHCAGGI